MSLNLNFLRQLQFCGKDGLEKVLDNSCFFYQSILSSRLYDHDYMKRLNCFLSTVLNKQVQEKMIEQLVRFHDPDGDQTVLLKGLALIYNAQKTRFLTENSNLFGSPPGSPIKSSGASISHGKQAKLLIRLWSLSCDEKVMDQFGSLFYDVFGLLYGSEYRMEFLAYLYTEYAVERAADVRKLVPCLVRQTGNFIMNTVWCLPNLMSTVFTSVTFLINCWRSLKAGDLIVEQKWIEEHLHDLILNMARMGNCLLRETPELADVLVKAGVGRLLRCITFTIVKSSSQSYMSKLYYYFLESYINAVNCREECRNIFFALLSPQEMRQRLQLLRQHEIYKKSIGAVLQIEASLKPLSRSNSEIFFVENHIQAAIDSLPDSDLLHESELGCWSLLSDHQHRLPQATSANNLIDKLTTLAEFFDDSSK